MKYIKSFKLYESSSDNFWKWFGYSKVVDNNGNPLIVYHGSKTHFASFDVRKKGSSADEGLRGRGFYFSKNLKSSQSYGEHIYEVFLKVENPFDLLSFDSLNDIIDFLEIDSSIIHERGRGTGYHSISVYAPYSGVFSSIVREKGFDGIFHGQEIVVFEPNQIKSVSNDDSWDDDSNIFS